MDQLEMTLPEKAAQLAEEGIQRSRRHAEAVEPGWTDRAYSLLESFCRFQGTKPFTSEDFRLYARSKGFEIAVPKALGAVFKRAARNQVIERSPILGKAFARHGSPCPVWVGKVPDPWHE